ncbi:ketosamine-3-kinase-like isoform X1 [Sycon ciliatum]|uniref:ketosamine-3-kinase-like isoform X1 n=1 Tax=Sycon ciliatum TaxID=27933 RepID=UPI0031F70214
MEEILKRELGTAKLKSCGSASGGCISNGTSYEADTGKVFVKTNEKTEAMRMFVGEEASLTTIHRTNTIRVPAPIKLFEHPRGTGGVFVMEHLDMSSCGSMQAQLGTDLGRLHQHNIGLLRACSAAESRITGKSPSERGGGGDGGNGSGAEGHDDVAVSGVEQFGFECTTCCGFLPQDNTWCASWPEFYARSRLQTQMDMLAENHGDREALQLWSEAQLKIDSFFRDVEVKPSLIHGDLWGGNVGQTATSPVVFDPASCYGHHEFDLGIGVMFGSFSPAFHNAYHKVVPKSPNFDKRTDLYQLFHHLNHWNHFGSGYRGSSISLLRSVAKGL